MQVDGFHRESGTAYEYHGDCWHGNKTAKQLFRETIAREKEIVRLGHTVVSVWGNDFKNGVAELIWVRDKKHFKFAKWTFNV